jgi:TerC family integral membrane protein
VRRDGRWLFTPLFLVLVAVEGADVVFAVDSIPAIFGITTDPFIVYTSNICAILGLRSLYFLLAGVMGLFKYLQHGLALVLVFIGGKMLLSHCGTHRYPPVARGGRGDPGGQRAAVDRPSGVNAARAPP